MVTLLLAALAPALADDTCTVAVEANATTPGMVRYGLYQPAHASSFPAGVDPGQYLHNGVAPLEEGTVSFRFEGLAPGTYAISAFVDEDGDGVFDKNLLGVPTEPWAVSNNVRNRMSSPTFEQASFTLTAGTTHTVSLDLR